MPTYREEEARLRQEHGDLDIHRVVLEQDLKREYQEFLQEPQPRPVRQRRPTRPRRGAKSASGRASTTCRTSTSSVHFPDFRIEYEVDGRERHEDVELFTQHYRGAHAAGRAQAGFRIYVVGSRGGGGRSAPHPRLVEEFLDERTNILASAVVRQRTEGRVSALARSA